MRTPLKLHDYQEGVVRRVLAENRLALFLDPGLGKTVIMLESLRRMLEVMDVSRMLVVAPLRPCYTVWPKEAQKWAGFERLRTHVLHADGDGRTPWKLEPGFAHIYIINPEGLPWLSKQKWPRPPEMLVVDESTKFKRASAQRSRALRRLIAQVQFPRRYILTGTPAPNNEMDLHGQFLVLDDGQRLGEKMGDFRQNFMVPVPAGENWKWKSNDSAAARIVGLIRGITIRMRARDHLPGLPEVVNIDREVILPPEARSLYEQLERELVLQFARGDVTAVNAGALTSKLRQIAGGSVYVVDEAGQKHVETLHSEKVEALQDLVEELGGEPLLVAYAHNHEVQAIEAAFGKCARIGGGVSAREGAEVEARWNRGEIPLLLVHPASGGHGLNLQDGGGHVCWFSLPWDLELYDQFNGRINRQGQKRWRVVIHHLISNDTIDEVMAHTLRQKDHNQKALLQALQTTMRSSA